MDIKLKIEEIFIDCGPPDVDSILTEADPEEDSHLVEDAEDTKLQLDFYLSEDDVKVKEEPVPKPRKRKKNPTKKPRAETATSKARRRPTVKSESSDDDPPKNSIKTEKPKGGKRRVGRPSTVKDEDPDLKPHKCGECGKRFKQKFEVGLHMATHMTEKNFKCEHCPNAYPTKSRLSSHMAMHRGKGFLCDICNKTYSTGQSLRRHIERHTSNNPRKIVKTAEELETIKAGGKIHKCPICGKLIKSRYRIKEHMVVHSTQKNFHCTECNMSFADQRRLRNHSFIHQSGFKCHKCGKTYAARFRLNRHMKMHEEEESETSENKKHGGGKIYGRCKKCGKGFKSQWKLNYHMLGVHGIPFRN